MKCCRVQLKKRPTIKFMISMRPFTIIQINPIFSRKIKIKILILAITNIFIEDMSSQKKICS